MSFDVTSWDGQCGTTADVGEVAGGEKAGEDLAAGRRRVAVAGWVVRERLGARAPRIPWFFELPFGNSRFSTSAVRGAEDSGVASSCRRH
jgi:hypothetical protein